MTLPKGHRLLEPYFTCPAPCSHPNKLPYDFIDKHFEGLKMKCLACKAELSAWDIALNLVRERFMWMLFYPMGAQTLVFKKEIKSNAINQFNLYDEGLPKDTMILDINFTGQEIGCMEVRSGNNIRRKPWDDKGFIQLYGIPHEDKDQGKVAIAVTWVKSSPSDIAWNNLVSAFDSFADGNLDEAVIPANVAVESKLYKLHEKDLQTVASRDRVCDFLENAATYSYQLNILLASFIKNKEFPGLDPSIIGLLNTLRKVRNDVAHKGVSNPSLTVDKTAELLTAALFGFRYIDYLEAKVN